MIEFVTKDGRRFSVDCARGVATMPNGDVRVLCRRGKGYVVYYYGEEIFGALRVKAASKEAEAVKVIDIATMRGYIGVLECLNSGWPIYFRGAKYRVLSVHKGVGESLFSAKVEHWLDQGFKVT